VSFLCCHHSHLQNAPFSLCTTVFLLELLDCEDKDAMILQNAGDTHPVTQYYIPGEDLYLQQQHCENSGHNLWHFHTWCPGVLVHEIWTNLKCFRIFDRSHFYFWKVIFNIFSLFVTCMNMVACLTCTHPSVMGICGLWCLRGTWHFAMGLYGLRCLREMCFSAMSLCGLWCLRGTWHSVMVLCSLWCLRSTWPCYGIVWSGVFKGHTALCHGIVWPVLFKGHIAFCHGIVWPVVPIP